MSNFTMDDLLKIEKQKEFERLQQSEQDLLNDIRIIENERDELANILWHGQLITSRWDNNELDIGECLNLLDRWSIRTLIPHRIENLLKKRDLIKQAEYLESMKETEAKQMWHVFDSHAKSLRKQASELKTT